MPFTVTGTLPRVKTKPDSSALAKMFQRGAGRRGTDELQRKFFGGKDAPATKDGESADEEPRPTRKKRSTEDLIRKGI